MAITKYNNSTYRHDHPFKVGIRTILEEHLNPSISDRFELILELEKYNLDPKRTPNLIAQKKDERYICEVYYRDQSGIMQYICDLCSWWSKKEVEFTLLKYITDKLQSGVIGKDWIEKDGKASVAITSRKHETPDSEITKYMTQERMVKKK